MMFENFVFQTEPVINEENEGIEQNTQIRSQGIIALSYRDWEVRSCSTALTVTWSAVNPLPECSCFQPGDCEDLWDFWACDLSESEPAATKCLMPAEGNISYMTATQLC